MLKIGLLWYDADRKRGLQVKMDEAAERYLQKFGVKPNTCHVNPADKTNHPWLHVVENKAIRHNHFWLGVDEELELETTLPHRQGRRSAADEAKIAPPDLAHARKPIGQGEAGHSVPSKVRGKRSTTKKATPSSAGSRRASKSASERATCRSPGIRFGRR